MREEVQGLIDAGMKAVVEEALRRMPTIAKLDGTIIDVDDRHCTVQVTGGGPDDVIECIRMWPTQAADDEVMVLFIPPSGAIAIGRLPAPTE